MSAQSGASRTPAEMVDSYIKLRDFKKRAEEELKSSLERVNKAMEVLEGEMLDHLNQTGATSIACAAGTVYRNTQFSATVENRDEYLAHCRENDQWEALDIKANKTFVREYMEHNGSPPPGVKVTQIATVGVRRS